MGKRSPFTRRGKDKYRTFDPRAAAAPKAARDTVSLKIRFTVSGPVNRQSAGVCYEP